MKERDSKLVEQFKINFPVLLDEKKAVRELYSLRGTPLTLVIDKEGRMFFKHYGYSPGKEEVLRAEIRELLSFPS